MTRALKARHALGTWRVFRKPRSWMRQLVFATFRLWKSAISEAPRGALRGVVGHQEARPGRIVEPEVPRLPGLPSQTPQRRY